MNKQEKINELAELILEDWYEYSDYDCAASTYSCNYCYMSVRANEKEPTDILHKPDCAVIKANEWGEK